MGAGERRETAMGGKGEGTPNHGELSLSKSMFFQLLLGAPGSYRMERVVLRFLGDGSFLS